MQNLLIEAAFLLFLIFAMLVILGTKDLLTALIVYAAFSFTAVLLYFSMGSPDVAFTEAVIGTISTIYFVIALRKLNGRCK